MELLNLLQKKQSEVYKNLAFWEFQWVKAVEISLYCHCYAYNKGAFVIFIKLDMDSKKMCNILQSLQVQENKTGNSICYCRIYKNMMRCNSKTVVPVYVSVFGETAIPNF